jgi:hypothetical protein
MRDAEGRYLSSDVREAINSFLLEKGCKTVDGIPNITNIHLRDGFYKTEFSEPNKSDIGYIEIPEHFVKSFIRDKKINKIISE